MIVLYSYLGIFIVYVIAVIVILRMRLEHPARTWALMLVGLAASIAVSCITKLKL